MAPWPALQREIFVDELMPRLAGHPGKDFPAVQSLHLSRLSRLKRDMVVRKYTKQKRAEAL